VALFLTFDTVIKAPKLAPATTQLGCPASAVLWIGLIELVCPRSVSGSGGLPNIFVLRSAQFLGESDEEPFRPANVAETIRVFILNYFARELRAALAELFNRLVDVFHREHDAEVA
jgi:hypothetical protein